MPGCWGGNQPGGPEIRPLWCVDAGDRNLGREPRAWPCSRTTVGVRSEPPFCALTHWGEGSVLGRQELHCSCPGVLMLAARVLPISPPHVQTSGASEHPRLSPSLVDPPTARCWGLPPFLSPLCDIAHGAYRWQLPGTRPGPRVSLPAALDHTIGSRPKKRRVMLIPLRTVFW